MDEMAEKPIGYDATGYEVMTKAVQELLNQYPALDGKQILFEELNENSGNISFSSDNGSLVMSESRNILGRISQRCQYPFYVVYHVASTDERQKLRVQMFLDSLGKWICGEPVYINGNECRLASYPTLAHGRSITRVTRSNSYGLEPSENGEQDWLMPVTVEYKNQYYDNSK